MDGLTAINMIRTIDAMLDTIGEPSRMVFTTVNAEDDLRQSLRNARLTLKYLLGEATYKRAHTLEPSSALDEWRNT